MKTLSKSKTLSPKLDVIFQAIFGEVGSEKITKGFLESIIKEKIESIDLSKNPILRREFKDEKLGVLDILAKINGKEECNIELQIVDKENIIERIIYYWSRIYSRQIKIGEDYKKLEKAIVILIANFEISEIKGLRYHSVWKIIEEKEREKILTEKFQIDIIELPKIKKENGEEDLLDWLYFIEDPKSERVKEKMEKNEELKEAVEKLERISEDERMQRIAELRQKAIMDEKAIYRKGKKEGIEEGKKEGIETGRKEEQEQIVIRMLENNVAIELIEKITKMTKEQIEQIKDK